LVISTVVYISFTFSTVSTDTIGGSSAAGAMSSATVALATSSSSSEVGFSVNAVSGGAAMEPFVGEVYSVDVVGDAAGGFLIALSSARNPAQPSMSPMSLRITEPPACC
jgi:hypothetical protein